MIVSDIIISIKMSTATHYHCYLTFSKSFVMNFNQVCFWPPLGFFDDFCASLSAFFAGLLVSVGGFRTRALQQTPINRYSVVSFIIRSADSLTDYSAGVKLVNESGGVKFFDYPGVVKCYDYPISPLLRFFRCSHIHRLSGKCKKSRFSS